MGSVWYIGLGYYWHESSKTLIDVYHLNLHVTYLRLTFACLFAHIKERQQVKRALQGECTRFQQWRHVVKEEA